MNKLLIYTCASGHYTDYTPLWEYCIKRSYPEYDYKSQEIVDPRTPYKAACYRLLARPCWEHKFIYITDVDMMILREDQTILDFHTNQMKEDGLCYSNSPRTSEYLGANRLTGLHFASQEWYDKTSSERTYFLDRLSAGDLGEQAIDDEIILMNVCKNSGLEIPKPRPLIKRHHGIHLGTLRHYQQAKHSKNTRNQQLGLRISPKQAKQWLKFYNDDVFNRIVDSISKKNKVIKKELSTLFSFCKRLEKSSG